MTAGILFAEHAARDVPRVTCPDCGAAGFTVAGFVAHRRSALCAQRAKGHSSEVSTEAAIEAAVRAHLTAQGWRR